MAHGKRAATKENKRRDYWASRPGNLGGGVRCRYTKQRTHRDERIAGRIAARTPPAEKVKY